MPKRNAIDLSQATLEQALAVLAEENRKRRENRKMIYWCMGGGMALLVGLHLLVWVLRGEAPDFAGMGSMLALVGAAAAFTATHKEALKRVGALANRESAGYLVEAYMTSEERDVKDVCVAALPTALNQVQDASDLDDYQRGLLYRMLNPNRPREAVFAALECTGRIAGAEAIESLEKFHQAAAGHKDAEWRRMGDRALQILPDVRIRAARRIIEQRVSEAQLATEVETQRVTG